MGGQSRKAAIGNRSKFAPFLRSVVPLPTTLYPLLLQYGDPFFGKDTTGTDRRMLQ